MATYTTRNRASKQAQNENYNSWGTVLNEQALDMFDEAIDGITSLALTDNATLTTANGATDQARKRVLNITSADQARTVTVPAVEKYYVVRNASDYTITLTVSGGNSTEVLAGQSAHVFSDGTNIYRTSVLNWGVHSTASISSVSTFDVTINDTNQLYTEAIIDIDGMTPSGTLTHTIALVDTSDTATSVVGLGTWTNQANGQIRITNLVDPKGTLLLALDQPSSWTPPDFQASNTDQSYRYELSNAIKSVRIAVTTGNFTAGTVRVLLR